MNNILNNKIAFITGITGQDGSYLAELLLQKGYKVYGIVRRTSLLYSHTRLDHIRDKLILEYGDLSDGSSLTNYITKITRDNKGFGVFEIYNLAAQSHVQISFEIPEYTSLIDGLGTLKLLEAIRTLPDDIRKKTKFYQAGTSEMFGDVLEKPQKETTPFNPQSPYACAKVYSHYLVNNYRNAYDLFACNGILFNHESSRRGENFVTMKIVNGVKRIVEQEKQYHKYMRECIGEHESVIHNDNFEEERIKKPDYVLKLGNIDSKRDWGHSKDYVYGMWLMLQKEKSDNYVLATGETFTVRNFIERCFTKVGKDIVWSGQGIEEVGRDKLTDKILVKIDEKYFRPCEVEFLLGDATKAEKELGWTRQYNLDALINDMMK
jgi:GDPmannose 4,6-dehydratase